MAGKSKKTDEAVSARRNPRRGGRSSVAKEDVKRRSSSRGAAVKEPEPEPKSESESEPEPAQESEPEPTPGRAPKSSNANILSASYLDKYTSKKDLVRRLRTIVHILGTDEDIDPDDTDEYPGLGSLAQTLVANYLNEEKFNNNGPASQASSGSGRSRGSNSTNSTVSVQCNKEIRLYCVVACMELFALYAPEAPWDENEILLIFEHTIRQLANISHTTKSTQNHYNTYIRIIELLAQVKIGVVLVELAKNSSGGAGSVNGDDEEDEDNDEDSTSNQNISTTALELLSELIRTILQSIRIQHNRTVVELCKNAITACLEEYYDVDIMIPIPILDEILLCVGQGPKVLVKQPDGSLIEQGNPSYLLATSIILKVVDRLSTPISYLLNGILNNDNYIVEQSCISSMINENSNAITTKPNRNRNGVLEDNIDKQEEVTVWEVIYELYQISSSILTTVIGTVSNGLTSVDKTHRMHVVKLLGRLILSSYYPNGSLASGRNSTAFLATQYKPCFRDWLSRCNDIDSSIRLEMITWLSKVLCKKGKVLSSSSSTNNKNKGTRNNSDDDAVTITVQDTDDKDVIDQINHSLSKLITHDSDLSVRVEAIQSVCDMAYAYPIIISKSLLLAIRCRAKSKNKQERRNALTGLVQIYYEHYVLKKLADVQKGGDDCNIDIILSVLQSGSSGSSNKDATHDDADDKYAWIPQVVFECVCFTDIIDYEMRNRVVQIVDDLLLGSDLPKGSTGSSSSSSKKEDAAVKSNKRKLTPTSRAVGLVLIMQSFATSGSSKAKEGTDSENSDSHNYMVSLFQQRANLQHAVNKYIDARGSIKDYKAGTEEAFTAEAKAMEMLEAVAALTAPILSSSSGSDGNVMIDNVQLKAVLQKFHNLRDKHIFRILATIADPTHTTKARIRAFDELAKRVKSSLGSSSSSGKKGSNKKNDKETTTLHNNIILWVKSLVRRCAMGDFINCSVIHHCILLAQECFYNNNVDACVSFIRCVHTSVQIFPSLLCSTGDNNNVGSGSITENNEAYKTLVELFIDCSNENEKEYKKQITDTGLITLLTSTLSISTMPAISATKRLLATSSASSTTSRSTKKSDSTKSPKGKKRNAAVAADHSDDEDDDDDDIDKKLQAQLMRLCTRDGTPTQARNAVHSLAGLLRNKAGDIDEASIEAAMQSEKQSFRPLLKALSAPSRLSITSKRGKTTIDNDTIVTILSSLTALAECAPIVFGDNSIGSKTVQFVWESIVLGTEAKNDDTEHSDDDDDDNSEPSEDMVDKFESPKSSTKQRSKKSPTTHRTPSPKRKGCRKSDEALHVTPKSIKYLLEDSILSLASRRVCAAIEFTVTNIRATILASKQISALQKKENKPSQRKRKTLEAPKRIIALPDTEHIKSVFEVLCQIVHNLGVPPSARDRKLCKTRQDRAAIRQCAAVHLLRLCDSRLGLERAFLTPSMWHILAGIFLDEEHVVREAVMGELSMMMIGEGCYCSVKSTQQQKDLLNVHLSATNDVNAAMAPGLRFVALVALCTDGENPHARIGHLSKANGNAANVGNKQTLRVKSAAHKCVTFLRKTCESTLTQCRSLGREGEKKFETRLKMMVMPEYMVPYAFHLLAHRRESPSAGGTAIDVSSQSQNENINKSEFEAGKIGDDESNHKVLRRRLKFLFEPLVQSLGESADNISFLLRMAEVVGKYFSAVDVSSVLSGLSFNAPSSPTFRLSLDSNSGGESLISARTASTAATGTTLEKRPAVSDAKLKIICAVAREVLLSFVKKDVDLSQHPGAIQLPSTLFKRRSIPKIQPSRSNSSASGKPASKPVAKRASANSKVVSTVDDNEGKPNSRKRRSTKPRKSRTAPETSDDVPASASKKSRRETPEQDEDEKKLQRVHFSPELVAQHISKAKHSPSSLSPSSVERTPTGRVAGNFGNLSPIPSSRDVGSSGEKTLGTTPPSILGSELLRTQDLGDDSDTHSTDEDEPQKADKGRRSKRRSSQPSLDEDDTTPDGSKRGKGSRGGRRSSQRVPVSSKNHSSKKASQDKFETNSSASKRSSRRRSQEGTNTDTLITEPRKRKQSESPEDNDGSPNKKWKSTLTKLNVNNTSKGNEKRSTRGSTTTKSTRSKSNVVSTTAPTSSIESDDAFDFDRSIDSGNDTPEKKSSKKKQVTPSNEKTQENQVNGRSLSKSKSKKKVTKTKEKPTMKETTNSSRGNRRGTRLRK